MLFRILCFLILKTAHLYEEHVACIGEMTCPNKILVENSVGKRPLSISRMEDNVQMDIKETV